MKQLKHFLAALLLIGPALSAWAQTAAPQLVVWQKNGEKVYYLLSDQPETTFEDGLLVISTQSGTTVNYQLKNVLRYTYENVATGVDLLPSERSIEVSRDGDAVTYRNLPEGATVSLYSANGMLIEQQTACDGQPLTISVSQRPSGVYIVKAGKETIKLLRK